MGISVRTRKRGPDVIGPLEPTDKFIKKTWFDINTNILKIWNGTEWVPETSFTFNVINED